LATETAFGTGVATQGGASYVPQVARDLQTAPVIPPGAFPNGQGTGEQYGSEIPGWYISLSSQESAATLAEWTAVQEARKREALAAVLAQFGADPHYEGILTGKRALEVAAAFENEVRNIEIDLQNGVGELPGIAEFGSDPEEAETLATTILDMGKENDQSLADKLKSCGLHVGPGKWITYGHWPYEERFYQTSVCFFSINYKGLFGRVIIESSFVEMCFNNHISGEDAWACRKHGVWEF
jgi:hypothetical protein